MAMGSEFGFDHRTAGELSFSGQQLSTLPEEIARCLVLSNLDLSNNVLSEIEKLRELKRLKNLNLSGNKLKELPEVFASSAVLEELDLSSNQLNQLSEWMEQLPCLKWVDLSWNQLRELSHRNCIWPSLQKCLLRAIGLIKLPPFLLECKGLRLLDLRNERNGSTLPLSQRNSIWNLPTELPRTLFILRIDRVNLASLPSDIGELISLEELSASENALTTLPESFSKLGRLRRCDLSRNQIMMLPEPFCDSPVLEYLDLYGNVFDSIELKLEQFPSLKQLDLWQNYFDPMQIPDHAELCDNLRAENGDSSRLSLKLEDYETDTSHDDSEPESSDQDEDVPTSPQAVLRTRAPCNEEECWDDEIPQKIKEYQPMDSDEDLKVDCVPAVQKAEEVDEHYFLPARFHPANLSDVVPNSVQIRTLVGQFDDADD